MTSKIYPSSDDRLRDLQELYRARSLQFELALAEIERLKRELALRDDRLREAQELCIEFRELYVEQRDALGLVLDAFGEVCKQRNALGEVCSLMSYPKGQG